MTEFDSDVVRLSLYNCERRSAKRCESLPLERCDHGDHAAQPEDIDYEAYGIKNAIVIDNTGAWRDMDGLGRHLKANGAARALLTAPGKGEVKNIIYGVNHGVLSDDDTVLSAASCTTNAIVPPLKVMNDTFGIVGGHVETIHAYTNDQNLTDNFHDKERRGRSAPLNMVITETGAASAVVKALPELAGKLTGNAIRVPVPNVSLAISTSPWSARPATTRSTRSCATRR